MLVVGVFIIKNQKMKYLIICTVTIFILVSAFEPIKSQHTMNQLTKKVNVWDTYVQKKDGSTMHFDILAPVEIKDTTTIYQFGKEYLKTKGLEYQPLTSEQCRLCHVETLRQEWETAIKLKGYYIIEMEGCN